MWNSDSFDHCHLGGTNELLGGALNFRLWCTLRTCLTCPLSGGKVRPTGRQAVLTEADIIWKPPIDQETFLPFGCGARRHGRR
jgi:hypothetical protein